jgi:hypothetical protein
MENIIFFIIGFFIGVIVVAFAIELGTKKGTGKEPASRTTQMWSLNEISNPRIIAEYLGSDLEIPKNSKLVVNRVNDEQLIKGLSVKKHTGIKGNYVLGDDRALILAGPLKKDEIGVWTVEKDILTKLNAYFDQSWSKGVDFKPTQDKKTTSPHASKITQNHPGKK